MEFRTDNPRISYLKWDDKEQVSAVCDLHIRLLPESILSKLGHLFLSGFYYSRLVKSELVDVYLYRWDGRYVGFISCTNQPFTFMRKGLKGNLVRTAALLAVAVAAKPSRLVVLLKYLLSVKKDKLMGSLEQEYGRQMGEYLSFGVLEEFRKCRDEAGDKTIPNVLMELVSTHFNANRIKYALLRILPSNTRAIRLYHKHSGYIIPSADPDQVVMLIQTMPDGSLETAR